MALKNGKDIEQALRVAAQESAQPIEQVYQSWAKPGSTRELWIEAGFFIAVDSA